MGLAGSSSNGTEEFTTFSKGLKTIRPAYELSVHEDFGDLGGACFPVEPDSQLGVVANVLGLVWKAKLTEKLEGLFAVRTAPHSVDRNRMLLVNHDFLSGSWISMGCVSRRELNMTSRTRWDMTLQRTALVKELFSLKNSTCPCKNL